MPELSAFRFPFRVPPFLTLTVAGETPNENEKDNRIMPPPPGLTWSVIIARSDEKISVLAVIVGVFNDTASGKIDDVNN